MEIELCHVSHQLDDPARAMLSGSVRTKTNSPSWKNTFELDMGSRGSGNRCSIATVDPQRQIRPSSIITHLPDQGMSGVGTIGADLASLANAAMVSCGTINGNQRAGGNTTILGSATQSQRRATPLNSARIPKSSHMASVSNEGISEGATNLILASWRANTEQAHSSN